MTLKKAGWKPAKATTWTDSDFRIRCNLMEEKREVRLGIAEFMKKQEQELWKEASNHHLGNGLEKGVPSYENAAKARKRFRKEGKWEECSALDAVICGGAWHHGRDKAARKCHRCGEPDTAWHAYWDCPKLKNHTEKEVTSSNFLKRKMMEVKDSQECLWGRAIQPMGLGRWVEETNDPKELPQANTPGFANEMSRTERLATDGSGGAGDIPKEARKVASGVAMLDSPRRTE